MSEPINLQFIKPASIKIPPVPTNGSNSVCFGFIRVKLTTALANFGWRDIGAKPGLRCGLLFSNESVLWRSRQDITFLFMKKNSNCVFGLFKFTFGFLSKFFGSN